MDDALSVVRYTKPQSFADCIGNELPLGWEEAYDPQIGPYYINHVNQVTQIEDPRLEWLSIQEAMLREYLHTAQEALEASSARSPRQIALECDGADNT
ncbi:Protein kibra [Papilio machaon]|uniref:Protein kibra n=1 Tax=Papilio machaon TaxID=76193 RepID=A0A194RC66_PAPMA|nr:Protein kibra [Papilio machaon]